MIILKNSAFARALDGLDDAAEEELRLKEQEEARERRDREIMQNTSAGGYQNMFSQFLQANMADQQEETINTSSGKKEEKKEETPEDLYHKFEFSKNKIRYFTDYMQSFLSEKSKVELPITPGSFALYGEGRLMLANNDLLDDMTDYFRNMLERTDNMQGVRVLVDSDTGFGSFAQKYIQEIKDEFPKKPIMLYNVTGPTPSIEAYSDERASVVKELRTYNLPLSIAGFNEIVDSIVPIDLNYGGQIKRFPDYLPGFNSESLYHTSSIPALAINDFYGPLTQQKPYQDLEAVLSPLNFYRRANIHLNSIKLPFLVEEGFTGGVKKLFELNKIDEYYKNKDLLHLSVPFWGPLHQRKPIHTQMNWTGAVHPTLSHGKLVQQTKEYCEEHMGSNNTNLVQDRVLLPIPYPRYFTPKLNHKGELAPSKTHDFVNNISTFSSVYSSGDIGGIVDTLCKHISNIPHKHKAQFMKDDQIEEEEFTTLRETVQAISDAYLSLNSTGADNDQGWSDDDDVHSDY